MNLPRIITIICCALLISIAACTKSGGSDSDDGGGNPLPGPVPRPSAGSGEFTTDCGVVLNGQLRNPVAFEEGEQVTISSIVSHNTVIVRRPAGQQLVRVQGVADELEGYKSAGAKQFLQSLGSTVYLFNPAAGGCNINVNGGQGILATLVTRGGGSFGEELVGKGYAAARGTDFCGGEFIAACMKALEEDAGDPFPKEEVHDFLWKPVADKDGKLVVLVGPYGVTIRVNGETGNDSGPGNGYGTQARFSKAGCAYGSARVTVTGSDGRPYLIKGQESFTISNGCERVEVHY